MSNSENLRAAVSKYRSFNDEIESKLGIDPKRSRVQAAEREVLRLARLVGRSADPKLQAAYVGAAHQLVDADVAVTATRMR
jgi:hypothetical protein